jgi:hypothetical protein
MFGAGEEFGADQMMEKLDSMKALIENVNAQFKNPVREPSSLLRSLLTGRSFLGGL